ncbi:MAG: DNA polymerase, partial [Flavobacteriaceae bacterium]|nr:DNA polymerase [Flavobacteriaceae bacterium]
GRRLYKDYKKKIRSRKKETKEEAKELREEIMRLGAYGVELYYRFRNMLNNAKNFPIQSTAAHVANASLIKLAQLFKEHRVNGWIALQIHDEITCIVKENEVELAAKLLKDAMENNEVTEQMDIPMIADPLIADNFAEAK